MRVLIECYRQNANTEAHCTHLTADICLSSFVAFFPQEMGGWGGWGGGNIRI